MAQLRGIVNYVLTAVLALLLVWGFSPLSTGVRGGLSVFILFHSRDRLRMASIWPVEISAFRA